MPRNLSIDQHWLNLARDHTPEHRFAGSTAVEWETWRAALLPKVRQTLGRLPEKPSLSPEILVEWQADGLIKQKLIFDVEPGLSATAYVFRPANATGPRPAILACHGHGPFGKESVMGNDTSPEHAETIKELNYDYGLQMAKAGFVTMAIDWRGFGDRDDRKKPHHHDIAHNRDLCNLHYLRASVLGMTMLGLNVHDGSCALDYLCQQPYVDADRIGVMGLSFGGTMATWIALCDERVAAADIICYSDRFADFVMRDVNACGSQLTPGLYALCDVPDLHGLIAPRPLLVEIGVHDECFRIESAMSCYEQVQKIYEAAGVADRLELDLFQGPHAWGANRSVAFFENALAND
ncbi:alpha/beta hydrolase family protein [Phycisphaerales bacterium AB-hyl4]|uniref:Alpha/beta hydrolase family protein n=1 Tax=Natronomicrosphaera hydrolytica TaxID=3242702 RepID=A0ABV4U379_9BACT